ncbi:MAG: hypothetical protein COA94_00335 [Rickettsiales bacterium]|nr:MAG: hypothetical protein COA94_00335 [Rickettsiales bacterium]
MKNLESLKGHHNSTKLETTDLSAVPSVEEQGRSQGSGSGESNNNWSWRSFSWQGMVLGGVLAFSVYNFWKAVENRAKSREYKALEQLKSNLKKLSEECSDNNTTIEKLWQNMSASSFIKMLLDDIKKNYNSDPSTLAKILSDLEVNYLVYIIASYCNNYLYKCGHTGREEVRAELEFARELLASKCNQTLDDLNAAALRGHPNFSELYIQITHILGRTFLYRDNTEADIENGIRYFEEVCSFGEQYQQMGGQKLFYLLLSARNIGFMKLCQAEFRENEPIDEPTCSTKKASLRSVIEEFKQLKQDAEEYTEFTFKDGELTRETIIPANDAYNRLECAQRIMVCYYNLFLYGAREDELADDMREIKDLIGTKHTEEHSMAADIAHLRQTNLKKYADILNMFAKLWSALEGLALPEEVVDMHVNELREIIIGQVDSKLTSREEILQVAKDMSVKGSFPNLEALELLESCNSDQFEQLVDDETPLAGEGESA